MVTKKEEQQTMLKPIREGRKVKGIVVKKTDGGVFVDCDGGLFTGVILQKEVRDLKRNEVDLIPGAEIEAEIINPDIRHKEGYFIISVSRLLQIDMRNSLIAKAGEGEVFTVRPMEANLGGLLVDMHGIKGFIPLSQLAPIHYPRVEDGDQEVIFEKLLALIGVEFKVKIISIDEDEQKVVLSEREALKEDTEKILNSLEVGESYKGIISGTSSYGFFVTLGGSVEGLVHISEITYGHVGDVSRFGGVGDEMEVRVIGLENGKISLSHKQLKEDPWSVIRRKFQVGDIIEGEVIRFVPYGVFIKMHEDINGLIHLSELTPQGNETDPGEVVKLGEVVKAKIILLDTRRRKIGLSMKALYETEEEQLQRQRQKFNRQRKYQRPGYDKPKDEKPSSQEDTSSLPQKDTATSPTEDKKVAKKSEKEPKDTKKSTKEDEKKETKTTATSSTKTTTKKNEENKEAEEKKTS